jgi:hypothetical protein
MHYSYLIIWDQAKSEGDNKKLCNKNYDKARTGVEPGYKKCRILCYKPSQQNQVHDYQCIGKICEAM